jgi:hypothetical protein
LIEGMLLTPLAIVCAQETNGERYPLGAASTLTLLPVEAVPASQQMRDGLTIARWYCQPPL